MVRLISRDPIMNLIMGLFTVGVISTTVCDKPRVAEKAVYPNNLEVQISQSELEPWKNQYMADSNLDGDELKKMADYLFWDNAHQLLLTSPDYRPHGKDNYRIISYDLNGANGPEVIFGFRGSNYTFRLDKNWDNATIYKKSE